MSRNCWLVALICLLSFGGGCRCVQNCHQGCVDSCGPNPNDPILGDCNKCGVCGGNDCPGYTPCGYMKKMMTCGAGCSEIYWGEWISDPPDCCDPCDHCGNWTGPNCGRRKPVLNTLKALWGTRYCGDCCSTCGEVGCDGGCAGSVGHVPYRGHVGPRRHAPLPFDEEIESIEVVPHAQPVPAKRAPAAPAAPEPKAAKPRPTRTTQSPATTPRVQNASATKYPWQPR